MAPHGLFQGPKFEALSSHAQAILMWLSVGPRNARALYNLPPGLSQVTPSHIAALMGKPKDQVQEALSALTHEGWIVSDEESGWIYIPGACRAADNGKHLGKILAQAVEHLENTPAVRLYLGDVIGATFQRARKWKKDKMPGQEVFSPFLDFFTGMEQDITPPLIPYRVPYGIQHRTENIEAPQVERNSTPEALQLLRALHPPGDLFSICAFGPEGRAHYRHHHAADAALAEARRLDTLPGFHGVYWGVAGLRKPTRGRGSEADALSICAVWIDVDTKDEQGNRDADLALDGLDNYIAAGRIPPPSATVETGGGAHAYWLLDSPATGADLQLIPTLNRELAKRVGGDNVGDLTRVLRVPGTRNRKPEYTDQPVCQIHDLRLERRYPLPWLTEFLDIDPNRREPETNASFDEIRFLDSLPDRWVELIEERSDVRTLWETPLQEGERSEAAQSLANYAAHTGITDPDEITTILQHAPALGTWAKDKPTALGHTIVKAIEVRDERQTYTP